MGAACMRRRRRSTPIGDANNDVQLEAALLMHFSVADVFTRIGDVLTVTERFLPSRRRNSDCRGPHRDCLGVRSQPTGS